MRHSVVETIPLKHNRTSRRFLNTLRLLPIIYDETKNQEYILTLLATPLEYPITFFPPRPPP